MFGLKKKSSDQQLLAPAAGQVVELAQTNDPVFSTGAMGVGFGLDPTDGTIYAPVTGKVTIVAETKHALGFKTTSGLEVLLHLGIDTVELKGAPFDFGVTVGQKVKAQEKVGTMDLKQITAAGYQTTIMTVITNSGDLDISLAVKNGQVEAGQIAAEVE